MVEIGAPLDDQYNLYRAGKRFGDFVNSRLRPDGVLLLRFIDGHVSPIVSAELAYTLWTRDIERTPANRDRYIIGHLSRGASTSVVACDAGKWRNI